MKVEKYEFWKKLIDVEQSHHIVKDMMTLDKQFYDMSLSQEVVHVDNSEELLYWNNIISGLSFSIHIRSFSEFKLLFKGSKDSRIKERIVGISLYYMDIIPEEIYYILDVIKETNIRFVFMDWCKFLDEKVKSLTYVLSAKHIKELYIEGANFEDSDFIDSKVTLGNIEKLTIQQSSLGVNFVKYLSSSIASQLTCLDLSFNDIKSKGLNLLIESQILSCCTDLNVTGNSICDASILHLQKLLAVGSLKKLNISSNALSAKAIGDVLSTKESNLNSLDISYSTISKKFIPKDNILFNLMHLNVQSSMMSADDSEFLLNSIASNIESLDIRYNDLYHYDWADFFNANKKLLSLDLGSSNVNVQCFIQSIIDSRQDLHFRHLNLSGNKFPEILTTSKLNHSKTMCNVDIFELKRCNLNSQNICLIANLFFGVISLDISRNDLFFEDILPLINKNKLMDSVILSDNNFHEIDSFVWDNFYMGNLFLVDVSGTNISLGNLKRLLDNCDKNKIRIIGARLNGFNKRAIELILDRTSACIYT